MLLVAESCVLGPGGNSHVVCPDWSRELVLFRQAEQWYCRTAGRFEIDGAEAFDRGMLRTGSRIAADDFSLTLETI